MNIDISDLVKVTNDRLEGLKKESVIVTVKPGLLAAIPQRDPTKAATDRGIFLKRKLPNSGGKAEALKVSRKRSKTKLRELAKILDADRGIFSDVSSTSAAQKDLLKVANMFAKLDKTPKDIKRLKNACRAYVRNPILRGDYDNNSWDWERKKGFNKYGIATGTLFTNIIAVYRGRRK